MLDLDHLFKLRLVVGRYGEVDRAGWWNSMGLLGPTGSAALSRGFPRTHWLAQARLLFAVASARCQEVFTAPTGAFTLWSLGAELEDEFERRWPAWQAEPGDWAEILEFVAKRPDGELSDWLLALDLVTSSELEAIIPLDLGPGKALELPDQAALDDRLMNSLAAGFSRGSKGELVVPFSKAVA